MVDYAALKTADAALGVADPAAAAAALNAQTRVLTNQQFRWADAKRIARQATTGDWSRIVTRARLTAALPPTTGADAAILAAINAVESMDDDVIDPMIPATWGAFQGGLTTLHAMGDLSDATVAAITALTGRTVPMWQPEITVRDVWIARGQPPL